MKHNFLDVIALVIISPLALVKLEMLKFDAKAKVQQFKIIALNYLLIIKWI